MATIKTIDLSTLNKAMLVDVAKSCGFRKDFARVNMPELVAMLVSYYEANDTQATTVGNAIYAHTPYGWSDIRKWQGEREAGTQVKMGDAPGDTSVIADIVEPEKISESSATNAEGAPETFEGEIIKEDLVEVKPDDKSEDEGDSNPFDSGKGDGDKDSKEDGRPEAINEASKTLAQMIRESEANAIAESALKGIANIPDVHEPLQGAIGEFADTLAKSIFATIAESMGDAMSKSLGGDRLKSLNKALGDLEKKVEDAHANLPHVIEVRTDAGELVGKLDGYAHAQFEDLLRLLNTRKPDGTRLNVWIVGPAGSGKTRAAIDAATVLGLTFRSIGALTAEHKAVGFRAAGGDYIPTGFREVWEHGGVFLFDEFDGSIANAAVAMNQAFSTPIFTFPDGMAVARHADCCLIAACNTYGNGSTDYVGRFKQDRASLDRFVFLDWGIDEKLEMNLATNKGWCKRVQAAREKIRAKAIQHLITPRATIDGCAMLASGFDVAKCDAMVLRKGLTADQWASLEMPRVTGISG